MLPRQGKGRNMCYDPGPPCDPIEPHPENACLPILSGLHAQCTNSYATYSNAHQRDVLIVRTTKVTALMADVQRKLHRDLGYLTSIPQAL